MPTFCPFVSIASLLHSTYNLLKLCDREPGAEKRLESVTLLLAETIKLKDVALGVVILIGIAMMLVDLWQSLQSKDD